MPFMVTRIKNLSPNTHQQIAKRVKAQLGACKRNMKDTKELAFQLAASKIVVAALQKQADALGIKPDVLLIGDEMADDLETTVDLLGLAKALEVKGVKAQ